MIEKSIFSDDLLGRDDELKNLSMLIEGTTEPLTLAINAAWGAGKTTFVKELWKPYLESKYGIESFYFSAWENDYSDEPLVSILGEFNSYLSSKDESDIRDIDKIKEAFINIGKLAIVESVKKVTADIVDVSALIDSYSSTKDSVGKFKEQISTLLASIYGEQNDGKPFVIFIDELDRCRPLYAIEFLERIKHLFGVKRLIFVLCIDKVQLAESIKSQYGNIDAGNYLRRFIDLEYQLPAGDLENFCKIKISDFRLKYLLEEKEMHRAIVIQNSFEKFFFMQVRIFNTPLRTIEQIISRLNIVYKVLRPRLYEIHLTPMIFLTFIKYYDSNIYHKLIAGKEREKTIVKELIDEYQIHFAASKYEVDDVNILYAIVDVAGLAENEMDILVGKINKGTKEPLHSGYSHYLTTDYTDVRSNYRLNKVVNTSAKLIEFSDRFAI